MRAGIGYDIHRFEEGRHLILGGVELAGRDWSGRAQRCGRGVARDHRCTSWRGGTRGYRAALSGGGCAMGGREQSRPARAGAGACSRSGVRGRERGCDGDRGAAAFGAAHPGDARAYRDSAWASKRPASTSRPRRTKGSERLGGARGLRRWRWRWCGRRARVVNGWKANKRMRWPAAPSIRRRGRLLGTNGISWGEAMAVIAARR